LINDDAIENLVRVLVVKELKDRKIRKLRGSTVGGLCIP
jgi:hypothetical protein